MTGNASARGNAIGLLERRRAVALTRHYREVEGLSIRADRGPSRVARRRRSRRTSTTHLMLTKDLRNSPHANDARPGCPAPRGRLGVLMLDRVAERRRAAQLARHYRDQEGSVDRGDRSSAGTRRSDHQERISTIRSGDKARAVKARYRGVCRGCGAPTAPRNGKGDAYAYCKRCHPGAIAPQWTRERVREAMRAWRARYGAAPSSYDWSRTHARRRGGEALKRLQAAEWPAPSTVTDLYGSWAAARADAFAGA